MCVLHVTANTVLKDFSGKSRPTVRPAHMSFTLIQLRLCQNTAPIQAGVHAGTGAHSLSRLLSLVLPFTAGLVLRAFEAACSHVALPAVALIGLALLQPSALSTGMPLLLVTGGLCFPQALIEAPRPIIGKTAAKS